MASAPVPSPRPRRRWVVLAGAIVFLAAFGVRFAWVTRVNDPYDNIFSDMGGYIDRAQRLAGLVPPGFQRDLGVYPFGTHTIYAAEMLLVGWKNHTAFRVAHCTWGAIVALCTMLLALRVVPRLWVGILLGLLVAVWQPLVIYSGFFSQEQLSSALLVLNAWLLARHLESGRAALAAGITGALAYVVKPQFILTAMILGSLWFLVRRRWPPRRVRRIVVCLLLAVGAGAVRYFTLTDQLGLICDEDAMHRLFADTDIGIVESSDGAHSWIFAPPSKLQTGEVRKFSFHGFIGDRGPFEQERREEVKRYTLGWRALHYLSNLSLLVARNELWPESDHVNDRPWRHDYNEAFKTIVLFAVCPLAALGMLSILWRPRVVLVIAAANVVTSMVAAVVFYGEARYRVPYDTFLIVLALAGIAAIVAGVRRGAGKARRMRRAPKRGATLQVIGTTRLACSMIVDGLLGGTSVGSSLASIQALLLKGQPPMPIPKPGFIFPGAFSAVLIIFSLGCASTPAPGGQGSPGDDASSGGGDSAAPPRNDAGGQGSDASTDSRGGMESDASRPPSPDGSTASNDAGSMGGDGGTTSIGSGGDAAIMGWPPADAAAVAPPDFGPNVLIFDPSMAATDVQNQLNMVSALQNVDDSPNTTGAPYGAEYSTNRYAYFFKPGQYGADVKVGFYVQALGLGHSPDDVTITGAVRSKADWRLDDPGDALLNFWRGAENMAVVPTLAADNSTDVWAVSQGTHLRRMHIKGTIVLSDGGYSSGGFIADSQIDSQINSGTQQQFLCRNTNLTSWQGGSWNYVFVGDGQAPSGSWSSNGYTVVASTPVVREKPFLFVESNGNYYVMVPALKSMSQGPSWSTSTAPGNSIPIDQFYLAHQGTDTDVTMNAALAAGKHLLLTPGIYHLATPLNVTNPGTIVLGLGISSLVPDNGNAAITVADVDGVTIAGFILDANAKSSPTLLQIGGTGSSQDHSKNPTAIFDVHCRIGGYIPGTAASCITLNSSDVILDNSWLWRSDDGAGVGWTENISNTGIIVNGDRVSAYGLFVEHFQQYQTMWNGNDGVLYFYQSEMPYDVHDQASWEHGGVDGYASYKVADTVTTHDARGLGVYCVFNNAVVSENAVETPTAAGVSMQDIVTTRWGGANGSGIQHIINGTGNAVSDSSMSARTP